MIIYKLINKYFLITYLFLFLIGFLLWRLGVISISTLNSSKGYIFPLVSIFFLIKIERVIKLNYISIICQHNVGLILFKTVGLLMFVVSVLGLIYSGDFLIFFKEILFQFILIITGVFLYRNSLRKWYKFFILSLLYVISIVFI